MIDALDSLKDDDELKAVYGDLFINGFIDESKNYMNENNILTELSSEYGDNDPAKIFITGFIYDSVIRNATIRIVAEDKVVGSAKSNKNGRWKISINKNILEKDKVLLFKGTAIDSNGDKILLQSAISTKTLREMAKRRISLADSIDLVISNVTTSQVAILEKNDKGFLNKPDELEKNKNKIELFQQDVLLKSAAAIKSVIDGSSTLEENEDTYSFILNNLYVTDPKEDTVILDIDEKISDQEIATQSNIIKEDPILSKQLLTIESEYDIAPILNKSLYMIEYLGNPAIKSYKKVEISATTLKESNYELKNNQWQKTSSKTYAGQVFNNVFYFDSDEGKAPYAIKLIEQKKIHSTKLNKDYTFDVLGKQLYSAYNGEDTEKVGIELYSESFDVVALFKEIEDSKIISALGDDYMAQTDEEKKLTVTNMLMDHIKEASSEEEFNRNESKLPEAIGILENLDVQEDDLDAKLTDLRTTLNSASANDKDAQVGKALLDLMEISNSETVGQLIELNLNGNSINTENNLVNLLKDSDNNNLEVALLENISNLSETSMKLVHETVLKLEAIEAALASNFEDETYTFQYKDFNLTSNQSKLLRVAVLAAASKLEYLTAFDYVSYDDIKTRTTVRNGITAEYTNFESNPVAVFNRSEVGRLNSTIGASRLTHAKSLLLKAIDTLSTVVATREDSEVVADIEDAQTEATKIKASLNGLALYRVEDNGDDYHGITKLIDMDLSALYASNRALDLTHTLGHDFKYEGDNYYDGYRPGEYDLALSQFYNEAMAKEWVHESNGSRLNYGYFHDLPTLNVKPKNMPMGSDSHILSLIKKITIKRSGEADIVHTGNNILKFIFNDLDIHHDYNSNTSYTYRVDKRDNLIPDSNVRYGVKILYGNIEIVNADNENGVFTVKLKDGFTGDQYYALTITDTLGHQENIHGYMWGGN